MVGGVRLRVIVPRDTPHLEEFPGWDWDTHNIIRTTTNNVAIYKGLWSNLESFIYTRFLLLSAVSERERY